MISFGRELAGQCFCVHTLLCKQTVQQCVRCPRNGEKSRFKPKQTKQDLFRVMSRKNFGLFRCFEPISKQPKQTELFLKQTETNRNIPEFSEKYQYMLSIKLFQLVFCLFGLIETPKIAASV
jgi:hypothetical protein